MDKSEDNFAEVMKNMSNTFAENLANGAVEKIDQAIMDTLQKGMQISDASNSKASNDNTITTKQLDNYIKQIREEKERLRFAETNKFLHDEGYPEFQKILDYFLDNHPEYKL